MSQALVQQLIVIAMVVMAAGYVAARAIRAVRAAARSRGAGAGDCSTGCGCATPEPAKTPEIR